MSYSAVLQTTANDWESCYKQIAEFMYFSR